MFGEKYLGVGIDTTVKMPLTMPVSSVASAMAPRVMPLPAVLASPIGKPGLVSELYFQSLLPADVHPGRQQVSATHKGHPRKVSPL